MARLILKIELIIVCSLILFNVSYANEIIDKKGKVVEEIIAPTAPSFVDDETISYAIRRSAVGNYDGPTKNIYSDAVLFTTSETEAESDITEEGFTRIRHTSSITDLTGERYSFDQDYKNDRLRLTIFTKEGKIEGKNGFFMAEGEVYYFDKNGLMVLGPCIDDTGKKYFFSYETGRLIE